MVLAKPTTVLRRHISSFGFSGAGFLVCYHLGVAQCLLDQGILPRDGDLGSHHDRNRTMATTNHPEGVSARQRRRRDRYRQHHGEEGRGSGLALVGVSAGALTSAALAAGVDPVDGMIATMEVSRRTREAGGLLDALRPGYSLVDALEERFATLLRDAVRRGGSGEDGFLDRIDGGRLLRIGLTDRRVFPPLGPNPRAYCYVDRYRGVDDVVAACVLSSYIPGVTGPAWGSLDGRNRAILRAKLRLHDMIRDGCVKDGTTGLPLRDEDGSRREICWDGGLVNAFPVLDDNTVIVAPLAATFRFNASINPSLEYDENGGRVRACQLNSGRVRMHLTAANAFAFRCISLSSEDNVLEEKFSQGYDNARLFLDRNNLVSVFSAKVPGFQEDVYASSGRVSQSEVVP